MNPVALDLDHVGIAVANLDAGLATFQRLGFNLTNRSHHKGSRLPGGPIEPWGSANHCAMLEQGYLEVLGVTDPSKFSTAKAMIGRYEGAHIVAFRPRSVEAAHSVLAGTGLPVDEPRDLERMAPYGPDGRDSRRVAFRNMYLAKSVFTEAQFQYTEHLTRDAMWQPHLLQHPNGANALRSVYFCCPDPLAFARKLSPLLGIEPCTVDAAGEYRLQLERSSLHLLSVNAWSALAPGAVHPPLPRPIGVAVEIASLDATSALLERNKVPFRSLRGSLIVDQPHAAGTVLFFCPSALKVVA
ncbi:MAG TPA: VOC family protein [Burkholderiales bacterium]|nr:VOC family protein [Burkholderiales bacterium]